MNEGEKNAKQDKNVNVSQANEILVKMVVLPLHYVTSCLGCITCGAKFISGAD